MQAGWVLFSRRFCTILFPDPQFLVSEEDIVEVGPDELQGTTRVFQPALQQHTSASQPKDVIFVERRGKIIILCAL